MSTVTKYVNSIVSKQSSYVFDGEIHENLENIFMFQEESYFVLSTKKENWNYNIAGNKYCSTQVY